MLRTILTSNIEEAAGFIRSGEVVAFPTETVYGLGADALNAVAIQKLFQAKRRPSDNPMIVHVSDPSEIDGIGSNIPKSAIRLIEAFFPGPLTLVLTRDPRIPEVVSAGLTTVGVRMPDHPIAREFLRACGRPVVAPSANVSGRPSPTTWQSVFEDLDGRISCILKADPTRVGLESTVVDCTDKVPVVLRTGSITLGQLQSVEPGAVLGRANDAAMGRSPGTRHRHYAPTASVVLIDHPSDMAPDANAAYIGLAAHPDPESLVGYSVAADIESYARRLFEFFRECDRRGVETIYCQSVRREGLGAALMDRIHRAVER